MQIGYTRIQYMHSYTVRPATILSMSIDYRYLGYMLYIDALAGVRSRILLTAFRLLTTLD